MRVRAPFNGWFGLGVLCHDVKAAIYRTAACVRRLRLAIVEFYSMIVFHVQSLWLKICKRGGISGTKSKNSVFVSALANQWKVVMWVVDMVTMPSAKSDSTAKCVRSNVSPCGRVAYFAWMLYMHEWEIRQLYSIDVFASDGKVSVGIFSCDSWRWPRRKAERNCVHQAVNIAGAAIRARARAHIDVLAALSGWLWCGVKMCIEKTQSMHTGYGWQTDCDSWNWVHRTSY